MKSEMIIASCIIAAVYMLFLLNNFTTPYEKPEYFFCETGNQCLEFHYREPTLAEKFMPFASMTKGSYCEIICINVTKEICNDDGVCYTESRLVYKDGISYAGDITLNLSNIGG